MNAARALWLVLLLAVGVYTAAVIRAHGLDFVTPFFGAIREGGWQGQFTADFLAMLILSAAWTGWRNRWSPRGILLALLALGFGAPFLCIYLLYLSSRPGASIQSLLLGDHEKGTH